MTVDQGISTSTVRQGAETGATPDRPREVMDRATEAAETAAEAGKHVAQEAKVNASELAGQISGHFQDLVARSREELRGQADTRAGQTTERLRSLAGELAALGEGRTQDAGQLPSYLAEARQRLTSAAERVETEGLDGMVEDVRQFARQPQRGSCSALPERGSCSAGPFAPARCPATARRRTAQPAVARQPAGPRRARSARHPTDHLSPWNRLHR